MKEVLINELSIERTNSDMTKIFTPANNDPLIGFENPPAGVDSTNTSGRTNIGKVTNPVNIVPLAVQNQLITTSWLNQLNTNEALEADLGVMTGLRDGLLVDLDDMTGERDDLLNDLNLAIRMSGNDDDESTSELILG